MLIPQDENALQGGASIDEPMIDPLSKQTSDAEPMSSTTAAEEANAFDD